MLAELLMIGAAYMTNLGIHEFGHSMVASDVGVDSNKIEFFVNRDGTRMVGISTVEGLPIESRVPYYLGGFRMEGHTFNYALESYKEQPGTFNKSLLVFSGLNMLTYSISSFYLSPHSDFYDPNSIIEELKISKAEWMSFVIFKTLLDSFRVYSKDTSFTPYIKLTRSSAVFMIQFNDLF